MTRHEAPRRALTTTEADGLEVVVRLPAATVETIARRAAEILSEADPPRGRSYLTVKDAALRLGVHENTIYRAIRNGRLPAAPVGKGRALRIETSSLDRFMESSQRDASEPKSKRGARRRVTRDAASSFSARARARHQVEPRPQPPSTKEVT